MNASELQLRRELWWVYANIIYGLGQWDVEAIRKRMGNLRSCGEPASEAAA